MNFSGKKILIMGLGIQGGGVGVARWFLEKGARVTVTDLKTEKELDKSLRELKSLKNKSEFVLGRHREEDFLQADLVICNPDVPQNSLYLKICRENNVPVEMDESLFMKLCPRRKNIIGVTGTRGKTTTIHLISAILKKAGYHVLMGGNLRGVATLSLLDKITDKSLVVLELSSWQLQGFAQDKISPHISVITNIYPDHLNRYSTMQDYVEDKKNIYRFQTKDDFLVLNKDYNYYNDYNFNKEVEASILWFSKNDIVQLSKQFSLKGSHNLENLAAARAVVKIFKIDDKTITGAIRNFQGVEFRLQEVAEIDSVIYVNDTTSTTPMATVMALRAYENQPIILICGGTSKNLPLEELVREIKKRVKALILIEGTGTGELERVMRGIRGIREMREKKKLILGKLGNLKEAVMTARKIAVKGEIVLFSPGFTSFGMFRNEYERGEKFNEILEQIKNKSI